MQKQGRGEVDSKGYAEVRVDSIEKLTTLKIAKTVVRRNLISMQKCCTREEERSDSGSIVV